MRRFGAQLAWRPAAPRAVRTAVVVGAACTPASAAARCNEAQGCSDADGAKMQLLTRFLPIRPNWFETCNFGGGGEDSLRASRAARGRGCQTAASSCHGVDIVPGCVYTRPNPRPPRRQGLLMTSSLVEPQRATSGKHAVARHGKCAGSFSPPLRGSFACVSRRRGEWTTWWCSGA